MTNIVYKIASMRILHSSIVPEYYDRKKNIQINNSFSFGVNVEHCLLQCCHTLTLKQEKKLFMEITLETVFAILPQSFNAMIKENKLNIATTFLVQCGSISYGSLRGIILQETNEKKLNNIIIPPLYIDEIIKEPMIVDLNEVN